MAENKPLGVTIKAPESARYAGDNPWFVFEGSPSEVAQNILSTFPLEDVNPDASVAEIVLAAQSAVTKLAVLERGLNPVEAPQAAPAQQAPAQPQQQPWGQQAPVQQAPQQGGGQGRFGEQQHPEGKQCTMCGQVLIFKKTSSGKATWRCPEWRWNNGNPNGHTQEWAN